MRDKQPSLIRQIGSLGSANIVYVLSQFGIFVLLSQLTDFATVAAYGFVMAVVQPLSMLLRLGLRTNLATDALREFAYPTFLSIRTLMSVLLLTVALSIIGIARPDYLLLALPVALMNAVEMHSDLCYGALQRAGRIRVVALSMMIRGPAALLLFGSVLYLTRDAHLAFWSQTVVWLTMQFFHDFPGVRSAGETVKLDFNLRRIWALATNSMFLGLGHFFASLQENVPRFFISGMLGEAALALFTAVSSLQRATVMLFNTIEQAIGWRLSQLWSAGKRGQFFAVIRKMLALAALIAAVGIGFAIWIGQPFLSVAFGPEYAAGYALLVWISCAIGLRLITAVLQTAVTAQRRFNAFGIIQMVVVGITFPAAWLGIMNFGLTGAGVAVALTTGLRMVIFLFILMRN